MCENEHQGIRYVGRDKAVCSPIPRICRLAFDWDVEGSRSYGADDQIWTSFALDIRISVYS